VDVSIERERAMVYNEDSMMEGFITSMKDEGATSYDDFKDPDINTDVEQIEYTHVEDSCDVEGVLAPNYDHSTPYPIYDSYNDMGMMVSTYDRGWVFERFPWAMNQFL
jgi:hypothetical protein